MSDAWDAPLPAGTCPWCSATNTPEARQCGSCGAAIAQREDLGGVTVPGVTGVDPNLLGTPASLASTMLRTQGTTNVLYATSQVNATLGLVAAAAVLGQDTIKGMLGHKDADLATVGKPSEAALLAAEKLDRERAEAEAAAAAANATDIAGEAGDADAGDADAWAAGQAPSGGGLAAPVIDPWADLPERGQGDRG